MKLPEKLNGIQIVKLKSTPDGRNRVMLKTYEDSPGSFVSSGYEQEKGESTIEFLKFLEKRTKEIASSNSRVPSSREKDYPKYSEKQTKVTEVSGNSLENLIVVQLAVIISLLILIVFLLWQN